MEFPPVYVPGSPKITILSGASSDLAAATYCLHHETHTLGNALRWMIMKNPKVEFCGYSVPHPSEPKIHLRIQMYDSLSSLDALLEALNNLDELFATIGEAYTTSLNDDTYESFEE
ncbi:hypothetical protein BOTBODRAFT_29414 [Botryobasidium botryosum FD-172 SS1]|uniref:DNA-directed RNA polymerases I and III subunit RPAC2 n=1 Tax=Botryobasidium botryosum (strain FD-172 SS1) TaxID=930990 RepID=A0A067MTQ8_BOTB1|nr:hypothetical protein BOTBODRAFT_29414 [Botryobasidium botryosum FD-172 SS1]